LSTSTKGQKESKTDQVWAILSSL